MRGTSVPPIPSAGDNFRRLPADGTGLGERVAVQVLTGLNPLTQEAGLFLSGEPR